MEMPPLPRRKTIRLQNYDYFQSGAYFVTICTAHRSAILGNIIPPTSHSVGAGPRPARVELSLFGEIVMQTWNDLPNHNSGLSLGPFIIMPDHIHGILILEGRAGLGPAPTAIPELVRQLKSFSSRKINRISNVPKRANWQRGYYEHILPNRCRGSLDCLSSGGQQAVVHPSPNLLGCHRYGPGQNYWRILLRDRRPCHCRTSPPADLDAG